MKKILILFLTICFFSAPLSARAMQFDAMPKKGSSSTQLTELIQLFELLTEQQQESQRTVPESPRSEIQITDLFVLMNFIAMMFAYLLATLVEEEELSDSWGPLTVLVVTWYMFFRILYYAEEQTG